MSQPNIAGLDLFDGLRNFVTSPFSHDDGELDAAQIADIQNRYNDQRDRARQRAGDLGFDGDYRPTVVKDTDPFETLDLSVLRAKVDRIDLDAVGDLIRAWNEISTRNSTSLDEFRTQIARGMSPDVWAGAAANAAAETIAAYDDTGKKVTIAAALTSNKLDELRTGLEPTKRLVPHEPEHRSGLDNFGGLFTGRGWRNDDVAQYNAKVEAVRVLTTVYAPVIYESDDRVPVIPVPKTVEGTGVEPDGGSTRPTSYQPDSSTPGTRQPSPNPGGTPESSTPAEDDTTPGDNPTAPSATAPESTTPTSTTPASTTSAGTTPAATTPAAVTVPGTGSPAGTTGGAGVPGGVGTGAPGSGTPAPGGSLPGGGTAGTGAAAPARAGGAGAGTAGRGGIPGMMGPGARGGGKDDESSKGIPDYLITQEHGDELTGLDDLPKTVPPVIGAD
ncbi:hypothetical protein BOX37_30895 [Nocardia mangyaensis]|uniref:PPE family domain-containing protein n=1 Tax=Nocardia mangyaensis TaxID=2213200 RepID=A0A1J0W098_9NOCA|nr:hypothetical protein [Nocardia mangyaensis]APE37607.1 hypothetical protein BOX37_30895 [Nocardia mangyaensis]